jgi:polysaccharide biosynthesis/export protein
LGQEIARRIKHLIRNPEVVVTIQEQRSQPVSVLGAVKSPGVIQVPSERTLIEVLAMAGGLKEDAGSTLKITRRADSPFQLPNGKTDSSGNYQVSEVSVADILQARNPNDNVIIQPHDVITVPLAPVIYVMGYVKKPGAFMVKEEEQMSALLALSLAEGEITPLGAPNHARVLRSTPGSGSRTELPIDLRKVRQGRIPDLMMRPGDILYIPDSLPKNVTLRTIETAVQLGTGIVLWRR